MKKGILERLAEGPVLGDGGYLLELEKRGWVRAGPFTPEVVLNNPDALRQLHVEFKTAGAEVLQALTFYASRDKLATVGLADKREEMNRTAVRIANEVAGEHVLVSGNLSLTWMYDPEEAASSDRVRKLFDEQLAPAPDGRLPHEVPDDRRHLHRRLDRVRVVLRHRGISSTVCARASRHVARYGVSVPSG